MDLTQQDSREMSEEYGLITSHTLSKSEAKSILREKRSEIFIKNLDEEIDNNALYDTFKAFGNILSCQVAQDENGQSKGYGFVHFETEESANTSIEKVNGMLLNEKKVCVGRFITTKPFANFCVEDLAVDLTEEALREISEEIHSLLRHNRSEIFIKNLDKEIGNNALYDIFKAFGNILSCQVAQDENGQSKGYGFVHFETEESANTSIEKVNGMLLHEKKVCVGRFITPNPVERLLQKPKSYKLLYVGCEHDRRMELNNDCKLNLYVKKLDDTIDDERLRKEFAPYGTITSAKVMLDDKGRSKGFGFVCFSAPDEATKAVTEMNGRIVGRKALYVALAQRKEERKSHLASLYIQRVNSLRMQHIGQVCQQSGSYFMPTIPVFRSPYTQSRPNPANQNVSANAPGAATATINRQAGKMHGAGDYPTVGTPIAMNNPYRQAGNVRGANQQAPNAQSAQAASAAMRNPALPITGQQTAANMQTRPVAPQMTAGQARGANYKFTQNMRNPQVPQQVPIPAQPVAPQAVIAVKGQEPLTASMLAAAQPADQKQMLGERLFPLIESMYPHLAGKITGMLLEIDNSELVHMLEHSESLKAKAAETVAVLHAQQAKNQPN